MKTFFCMVAKATLLTKMIDCTNVITDILTDNILNIEQGTLTVLVRFNK